MLFRLHFWLCASVLLAGSLTAGAHAADNSVGRVSTVVNQAQIGSAAAVVGTPVHMKDELRTGARARLQVTFRDNTTLTLGENARVIVDRYVFNPAESRGEVALKASRGAIRFAGGKLKDLREKKITVTTPSAALAVRGTEFWAGPIDGRYGVLLLHGKLRVSGRVGAATPSRASWRHR
jgi:hypothetical protein